MSVSEQSSRPAWRNELYEVIFEADTPAGRAFDVVLILTIVMSVVAVMLESVSSVQAELGDFLRTSEWIFTILFTVEYAVRLISAPRPAKYALSFFGIVDLLAVVPTYISVLVPGAQYLLVVRLLRILRVFRVLKLMQYIAEANVLIRALRASRRKIEVFVFTVLTLVVILGSIMYLIEGAENGFTSIPRGIYWAIVTLTTVGFGDISPQTNLGQAVAALIMMTGYGIIAVPTGIVTSELRQIATEGRRSAPDTCSTCDRSGHDDDAAYCKYCGRQL